MTIYDEKPELTEDLLHFGVKGMRWGHRKAQDSGSSASSTPKKTKVTTDQIKEARSKSKQTDRALAALVDEYYQPSTTQKRRVAIDKQGKKIENDWNKSDDRVNALRMTRGEKVASLILLGPLGLAPIVGHNMNVKNAQKDVNLLRSESKK